MGVNPGGKSGGLPPGLAKRDSLPPGLQKQLEKHGRLPPGLATRDLPADLTAKLPRRAAGQDVTVVEDDVVLVDKATGVILDVIKDVVRGQSGATGPQSSDDARSGGGFGAMLKNIFGGD